MSDLFWNVAAWLEKRGIKAGLGLVFAPLLYDWIGLFYGRHFYENKILWKGEMIMVIGAIIIALSKKAKDWGRK